MLLAMNRWTRGTRAPVTSELDVTDMIVDGTIPDYVPPPASLRAARQTLQPLVDAVAAAVAAGVLDGDPEQLAHRFWAAGHGRISLEINGFLPVDDNEYEQLCRRVIDGHRTR